VDLHTWMLNDVASVRSKLCDGVLARVPPEEWADQTGGGSSIRHLALHLARHQDLAVNTAVRDHEPLFLAHRESLGLTDAGSGAALAEHEDPAVSGAPTAAAVVDYVDAVFDATLPWLERLGSMVLDTFPDTSRRLRAHAGLADDEFGWLYAMWTDKPVWWFLQWPVVGHGHTHAGEATAVRNRLGYSPFAPPKPAS
jgi:DinB superfamily